MPTPLHPGNGAFGVNSRMAPFCFERSNIMATACQQMKKIQGHPCFEGNHHKNGRMHLAVAPACNIKCGYCTRKHDCANESRPGVTSRLLTPMEALDKVREVMASPLFGASMKVVGIAGPGDPLANRQTFETFRLVGEEFPELIKCMSTNGLLLPESLDSLHEVGLHSLTVTINAVKAETAAKIYSHIFYHGRKYSGKEAGEILLASQYEGVQRAVELGMVVKVNTVLIPGINEAEVSEIAERVKGIGAFVMNVMPLIPQAELAHIPAPSAEMIASVRDANDRIIGQMRHCKQCRADAVGFL